MKKQVINENLRYQVKCQPCFRMSTVSFIELTTQSNVLIIFTRNMAGFEYTSLPKLSAWHLENMGSQQLCCQQSLNYRSSKVPYSNYVLLLSLTSDVILLTKKGFSDLSNACFLWPFFYTNCAAYLVYLTSTFNCCYNIIQAFIIHLGRCTIGLVTFWV